MTNKYSTNSTIINVLFTDYTQKKTGEISVPNDDRMTTVRGRVPEFKMVWRWLKISEFIVAFMGKFSIDDGPDRHFSIDTDFSLDIFTSLWLTLLRPWHVADLLGFSYIEEEERWRKCWNNFFYSGFSRRSFFSNQLAF